MPNIVVHNEKGEPKVIWLGDESNYMEWPERHSYSFRQLSIMLVVATLAAIAGNYVWWVILFPLVLRSYFNR